MADKYDVIVVGAGIAGLSAALTLGRSLRRVLVLDGGAPRNAPSEHSHNLFTRDGASPDELLRLGRRDLEKYETVEVREGLATEVFGTDGDFTVRLEDGGAVSGRKLLIASGVVDEMPDIAGFAEAWGRGIYHCPYCHGWEVRERPLAVYGVGSSIMNRVTLIRNLSRDLVAITDATEVPDDNREKLEALGVPLYEGPISTIESDAEENKLTRIILEDGTEIEREGMFTNPAQRQRSELAKMLGCEIEYIEMMWTYTISADPMTRETTVGGVFAAGDAGKQFGPTQSLPNSVATGSNAGAFINHALASDDIEAEIAAVTSSLRHSLSKQRSRPEVTPGRLV